jgi:hypothetical protein
MKTNVTPSQQFKILWKFFAKHYPEVAARGTEELLPEQKAALAQLASGTCDRAAREKLIPLLKSNRHALTFLAKQIKLSRPSIARGANQGPARRRKA